jgi:hypothetical protein
LDSVKARLLDLDPGLHTLPQHLCSLSMLLGATHHIGFLVNGREDDGDDMRDVAGRSWKAFGERTMNLDSVLGHPGFSAWLAEYTRKGKAAALQAMGFHR